MPHGDEQVGVITGAASGIGAATASELARRGLSLVLIGRPEDDLSVVVEQVRTAGGAVLALAADVRDPVAIADVTARAMERFGRIDVVCANAGIADQSSIDDGDPVRWRAVLETNVLGVMHVVRAVVPHMKAQGSGHVIITASTSGRESYVGEPAYISSKWGVVGLGHALRQELSPAGIKVTLIEPGLVATPLTTKNPKLTKLMQASEPLQAEDVAAAIAFAFAQPRHVVVSELTLVPLKQGNLSLI